MNQIYANLDFELEKAESEICTKSRVIAIREFAKGQYSEGNLEDHEWRSIRVKANRISESKPSKLKNKVLHEMQRNANI
jgi:hypothetical protein